MKNLIQWTNRGCIVTSFFSLIYHVQLLRVPDPAVSHYIIAAFSFCVLIVSSILGFDNSIIQQNNSLNNGDKSIDLKDKYRVEFIQNRFPEILNSVNTTYRAFQLYIEGKSDFPHAYRSLEILIDRGENEIIEKIDPELCKSIGKVKNELNQNIRRIGQLKTENINIITEKWTKRLMQEKHKGISEKDLCTSIMALTRVNIFINNLDLILHHFDNRMNNRIPNYGVDPYPNQVKDDFVEIVKEQNKDYYSLLSETIEMNQKEIADSIIPKLKQYIATPL